MIWIVYDKERIKKNIDFVNILSNQLKTAGIKSKLVFAENIKRCKMFPQLAVMRTDFVWVSKYLESKNVKVCNNSMVCENCNDKYKTYLYLKHSDIDVIDTALPDKKTEYSYPVVVKSKYGHGGTEVFLVKNHQQLCELLDKYPKKSLIVQPLVDCGKDKRTYVVGNKIVVSMLRTSQVDFRSNFSLGGKAEISNLTFEEKKLIDKVLKVFDFDFAGIDLVYKNGKPYVNEIEDVVGSRMVYQNTNIDMIKEYAKHIVGVYKNEV